MTRLAVITVILATVWSAPAATNGAKPEALQRTVFLGASVTDGYGLAAKEDCWIAPSDIFRAAYDNGQIEVARHSSSFVFANPSKYGRAFVDAALRENPSLVIGIDFLFWFGYGFGHTEERRLELFEEGVALLSRFDCPLIVGDYPNMTQAIRGIGFHGQPMIGIRHIPETRTLIELNRRLKEWAAKRGRVTIVPLNQFMAKLKKNEPITVLDNRYEGDLVTRLLDPDLLHTTLDGNIALTLILIESILDANLGVARADFVTDAAAIRSRVLAPRAAEIAQRRRLRAR
jgi:hypothetical protein